MTKENTIRNAGSQQRGHWKAGGVVFSLIALLWLSAHLWNLAREVPKFEYVDLRSDPDAFEEVIEAFQIASNDVPENAIKERALASSNTSVLTADHERCIRWELEKRSKLWPRRIAKIVLIDSNTVKVIFQPNDLEPDNSRIFTRSQTGEWLLNY